jgi:hypothetical protein
MVYRNIDHKLVERVINDARIFSVSLFQPLAEKYPRILEFINDNNDTSRFDYLMTICLFAGAISASPRDIPNKIFSSFSKKLQNEIKKISQDMYLDFCSLMNLVAKVLDNGIPANTGIGGWFMLKFTDHNLIPSIDNEIADTIGNACISAFSDLWQK